MKWLNKLLVFLTGLGLPLGTTLGWLQLEREIDNEFAEWVLKKVPTRKYKISVKIHEISFEDVRKALKVLSEKDLKLHWLYRLLLKSGIRLAHALELIASWNPGERVFVEAVGKVEERCKCSKRIVVVGWGSREEGRARYGRT